MARLNSDNLEKEVNSNNRDLMERDITKPVFYICSGAIVAITSYALAYHYYEPFRNFVENAMNYIR